jgi:major membrane immunogen (membrane-anchored lipoprotein)
MLTGDGELSSSVDGISGATYSVRSMKKVAKLALLLDGWAAEDNEQKP